MSEHIATRGEVAAEIRSLIDLLALDNAGQLAALLRNDGDTYPSSGLIRTYLNQTADPADKFTRLLRARRSEVESQLSEGVQAVTIAKRLQTIFLVQPKEHIITLLTGDELNSAQFQRAGSGDLGLTVLASLGVPDSWVHSCQICGRPFVARSPKSRYCYRRDDVGALVCRLAARKLARKASKRAKARSAKIG